MIRCSVLQCALLQVAAPEIAMIKVACPSMTERVVDRAIQVRPAHPRAVSVVLVIQLSRSVLFGVLSVARLCAVWCVARHETMYCLVCYRFTVAWVCARTRGCQRSTPPRARCASPTAPTRFTWEPYHAWKCAVGICPSSEHTATN